jgi:hypothetical protein
MGMTRRDYELVSNIMRQFVSAPDHAAVCRALAEGLSLNNPRFDTPRFLKACGL